MGGVTFVASPNDPNDDVNEMVDSCLGMEVVGVCGLLDGAALASCPFFWYSNSSFSILLLIDGLFL